MQRTKQQGEDQAQQCRCTGHDGRLGQPLAAPQHGAERERPVQHNRRNGNRRHLKKHEPKQLSGAGFIPHLGAEEQHDDDRQRSRNQRGQPGCKP